MTGDPTPLVEIEQVVQARARDISIGPDDNAASTELLKRLVQEEIRAWNDGYRRGTKPFEVSNPEILAERAMRNLTGYGPLGPLLEDDDVWEIMINRPDAIFVKRHRGTQRIPPRGLPR